MAESDTIRFSVVKADPLSGLRTMLGQVALGDVGMLELLYFEPGHQRFLEDLVSSLNRKPLLHVSAMPPPDSPRFSTYSEAIERTDPRFFDALQCFLTKHYRVFLAAPGESIEEVVSPGTMLPGPLKDTQ